MQNHSGDANNMVTDGGRTTEDGFGEIARKLILQINEITPLQWDRHDDRERAQVEYALQAAYDKGRSAGRVEGLREGRVKIQERVDFYTEQEQQSQGPIRAARGLQRNEASGCAEKLARLIEQATQGGK